MTTWKPWATGMVKGIAEAAKARRTELELTAAELAERTSVGKPLSRAVISDLETGRKLTLDVSELVTLAKALEISPLSLVVPDVLSRVEVLPGVIVPGIDAAGWWTGVGGVTTDGRELLGADDVVNIALQLVTVEKTLGLVRVALGNAERRHKMYGYESDRDKVEQRRERIELLSAERQRLMDLYRDAIDSERADDA